MRKILIIVVCIFWGIGTTSFAQQVEVRASLDSNLILIGAQTNLRLEVFKPEGLSVVFPPVLDTLARNVEVIDVTPVDSVKTEQGKVRLTRNYTITSFDSGYHQIPPLPILALGQNEQYDTFYTQPLGIDTWLVPVDTSLAIKPIKGPENIPLSFREVLPWILGILLVVALAAGGYFYLKKRKQRPAPEAKPPKPQEPPYVIALRELDQLKNDKLWQAGKVKDHHARLSEIMRKYIESRFQIPALEHTNDEIFSAFQHSGLVDKVPYESLRQMLFLADLVKFAKGKPQPSDNHRSMEQAYEFVEQTKTSLETSEKVE